MHTSGVSSKLLVAAVSSLMRSLTIPRSSSLACEACEAFLEEALLLDLCEKLLGL